MAEQRTRARCGSVQAIRAGLAVLTLAGAAGVGLGGPVGVYCSCPPTSAMSHSVLPDIAALPYVDGTLLRIGWGLLEPSADPAAPYDWSVLDAELERAELYDQDVALAVVLGSQVPGWLESAGAQFVEYDFFGETRRIVAPWDPVFRARWTTMVAALGERYAGHPRIKLVHVTNSSHNGFEMQLVGDTAAWQAAGYSVEAYASSWETAIDAFDAAFPATPLDVEVHPVLGSDAVAERVAAYGHDVVGDRFGVFAAWWTKRNAEEIYPGMNTLLLDAAEESYGTVQVARSETVHGAESFGEGGLAGTLELAADSGVRYAEVWNSDLLNPDLDGAIMAYAEAIAGGCTAADVAEPFGVLDLSDVGAFVGAFVAGDLLADLTGEGVLDLGDLSAFVVSFGGGCP